ncbi:MAG: polymerase delta subunit [Candidatus Saccharibacteria bacterium]|nr:polymerase delta subunit [Candidatus Saccharibacteria bacterium]
MSQLVLNPITERQLQHYLAAPSHGLLLSGPVGAGKWSLGQLIAAGVLGIEIDALETYPYIRTIRSDDGRAISIESVRALEQFLSLKVPRPGVINRVVLIESAHLLGLEAQNALLKTLEEPPAATAIILLTDTEEALLLTVRSRLQTINVKRPAVAALKAHLEAQNHAAKDIGQALAISGGLPGLASGLLRSDDHPLQAATALARQLLQDTMYQRLLRVDELTKQKTLVEGALFIMQQMAHARLQTVDGAQAERWQQILRSSYEAAEALTRNAQTKLVLDKLMVSLG